MSSHPVRPKGWKRIFGICLVIVLAVAGLFFLVSRIDRAVPLTAEQMTLKPGAVEIASDSTAEFGVYANYLAQNAKPPVDYVVETFRTHDVVMLGEAHQIREDCELIARLIEPVYRRAGVRVLAIEVIKQGRVGEVNRLVTAAHFDEQRVVQIFRQDYFYWGFQEYLDILKAVWSFNQTLKPGEPPLRIIGLTPDMDIYAVDCGSLPAKLWQFPKLLRDETLYATPILHEVLDNKEKVLVQVGYFHTFLNYRQPKVIDGKMYGEMVRERMGRKLREELGEKVFQIDLHVRTDAEGRYTDPPASPVVRLLEKLHAACGNQPIGFDIRDSPFAMLRDTSNPLFAYQKYVTLGDVAEGYILQKPFAELHAVKWVDGFVTAANFNQLRTYALQRNLMSASEGTSPEALQQKLSSLLADGVRFP